MFKVLAAILHLGNVTITEGVAEEDGGGVDSEGSAIPVSSAWHQVLLRLSNEFSLALGSAQISFRILFCVKSVWFPLSSTMY